MDNVNTMLDYINVYIRQSIAGTIADLNRYPGDFEVKVRQLGSRIDALLWSYFIGYNFEPYIVKHPRDWWQAFRERWFPGWWLKKYPVVYDEHRIDFFQIYPDWTDPFPDKWSKIKVRIRSPKINDERDVPYSERNRPVKLRDPDYWRKHAGSKG